MYRPQSALGNGDDNVGIPDDLRCKRSDGKQWRCTAMSMPDKTVCEKHYIQAKKRAANSAMRASLKKAKRKSLGENDIYLESKRDEFDIPLVNMKSEDYPASVSAKKHKEKALKIRYSPEMPIRSFSACNSLKPNDDLQRDLDFEENWDFYETPPLSTVDSYKSRPQRSFDASAMTELSDGSTESSEDTGGQICHQCHRNDKDEIIWCQKCNRRGFCGSCISEWYLDIPLEEIEKVCPVCRGICNCKVCLRGDNMVKVRIREIPVLEKLQYLYCLLSSVLPVVKRIHHEQCCEVELEKRLHGSDIDLARVKLNADEQMCCNICRIPIVDYHRRCSNCSYDLCLHCCQDLRGASTPGIKSVAVENEAGGRTQEKETSLELVKESRPRLKLSDKYPGWKANSDGSIPCPPKQYGGCNFSSLNLGRIFKMSWVAKLVKNVEEMVSGCKIYSASTSLESTDFLPCQYAHREDSTDNFLYCPSSDDIKAEGINNFRKHWVRGEPVIVKQVLDSSSISSWDPMVIWRGIQETSDEKMKDANRMVKAIDCSNNTEVKIELGQFIKGYSEGRILENGLPEMLKLKDWPSPSASEEFLLYQRPDFLSRLPLLEYIHSRLGLLNVAAKLPHYSLQNDVGPRIYLSYGTYQELGRGDSVSNLHVKMRDMVYLLVHTCKMKLRNDALYKVETSSDEDTEMEEDHGAATEEVGGMEHRQIDKDDGAIYSETAPGVHWDVFRRQDVAKLVNYLQRHWEDFMHPGNPVNDFATHSLFDGVVFLDEHHKRKLKEEFGIEPWSFEQHLGQAVFVPAGCLFQMKNFKSTVQLGLDFLSPESVGEAARLAEEIRCLPNDNDAKVQILEVGKISLYAASSAIKEVQKLVLDPKLGADIGFEDPNLTASVSENLENLEKVSKKRQITCP